MLGVGLIYFVAILLPIGSLFLVAYSWRDLPPDDPRLDYYRRLMKPDRRR